MKRSKIISHMTLTSRSDWE